MTDSQWAVLSPDGSGGGGFAERRVVPWLEEATALKNTHRKILPSSMAQTNTQTKKRIWRKSCLYNCLKVRPSVFWFLCMVQLYLIAQEVLFFAQFSWKSLLLSKLFSGLFCRVWRVRLIASNVNIYPQYVGTQSQSVAAALSTLYKGQGRHYLRWQLIKYFCLPLPMVNKQTLYVNSRKWTA